MESQVELDQDNLHICQLCCKTDLLRTVASKPFPSERCVLCNRTVEKGAHTSDLEFVRAVKASVLYHFSDWDFDTHFGGESLSRLLSGGNPLFATPGRLDDLDEETFVLSFLELFNEVKEVNIWYETCLPAVRFGEHRLLSEITKELEVQNYYLVEERHENALAALKPHVCKVIHKAALFHRARIGSTARAEEIHLPSKQRTLYYEPYSDAEIGAPPVNHCSAGRLNRPGISMLYLGSTAEAAIAEVRPHPGENVSIGQFIAKRDLTVADFATHDLESMHASDELLDLLRLRISIERALTQLAPPSDQRVYSVTQFVGQVFRRMGFDGILYRSTVSDGLNLAVFDPSLCEWVQGSSMVMAVKKVIYNYDTAALYDPRIDYDIDYARLDKWKSENATIRTANLKFDDVWETDPKLGGV